MGGGSYLINEMAAVFAKPSVIVALPDYHR